MGEDRTTTRHEGNQKMSNLLCIYHANCADGFGSAWVFRRAFRNTEFYPGAYQDPPPDVTNRDVYMVDFSYKRHAVEQMARQARSITILDHHKSAIEDLMPLVNGGIISAVFDINRSGAMITWDYFFHGESPPKLLAHIEDRDLWRFALPGTREIQAALFSYPYDFEVWDQLMEPEALERLRSDGEAIERKHHKDIAELVAVCKRRMKFRAPWLYDFINIPAASLPYTLTSDAGHLMAQGEPFAACYWDTPEGRVFSLRSTEDGVDVSEVAKQYGGGGHKHAAGFRVPFDRVGEFEL